MIACITQKLLSLANIQRAATPGVLRVDIRYTGQDFICGWVEEISKQQWPAA